MNKLRHELKHQINLCDAIALSKNLGKLMEHDINGDGNGYYFVKSLYFDNYQDKVLREKISGVSYREKFRIRIYNNDLSYIKLEKKSKLNSLCAKESSLLTKEECMNLINNDYEFLRETSNNLKLELYSKMVSQVLRPKTIVEYVRQAYVYSPGNTRITLDSEIRGSDHVNKFLDSEFPLPRIGDQIILEVKYDEYLPEHIRKAIRVSDRKNSSFSKYAGARIGG